ncbi:MAG: hypothetical protein C0423_21615 [Methylibium sp.]|nr:hypothetical protein [Methylibium sp.]
MNRRIYPHRMPRRDSGYVLLIVLSALAVMAFVIGEFATRIDEVRRTSLKMQEYADARRHASDALAVAGYWIATRRNDTVGLGDARGMVVADGRAYRWGTQAYISFQDLRGMLSLNLPDRQALQQLLINDGVPVERTDAFIDTLLDYTELGSLKRLNGAGPEAYSAMGLPPRRQDWLRSYHELGNMPYWSENAERLERLQSVLGVRRSDWINPNTASEPVLRALFPRAAPEQIQRLLQLRRTAGFMTARAAALATGLALDTEVFLPYVGPELLVTVWARGLPRAIQYNVLIVPGGVDGPWLITELHTKNRPKLPDDAIDIPVFPLETVSPGRYPAVDPGRP